jgi:hypothetical protein
MRKKKIILLLFLFCTTAINLEAQKTIIDNDDLKLVLDEKNMIRELVFKKQDQNISFLHNEFAGFSWYIVEKNGYICNPPSNLYNDKIQVVYKDLTFETEYAYDQGRLKITTSVTNNGHLPCQPEKMGLRAGINAYMESYPDWLDNYFPTMLRCERTHLWGYFMNPNGHILTIATREPVASWSMDYPKTIWGEYPHIFYGHRIASVNLDFFNTLPLPERHPQDMWQLLPGETRKFHIYLQAASKIEDIPGQLSLNSNAPYIDVSRTAYDISIPAHFRVIGSNIQSIDVLSPSGYLLEPEKEEKPGRVHCSLKLVREPGLYTIRAENIGGKVSEASFSVLKPYSWYMQKAMKAVIDYPQKASKTHLECWYGFNTAFAGGKHFPENEFVKKAEKHFQDVYPLIFDTLHFEPLGSKWRICNVGSWIGILVDRYELTGNRKDLDHAIGFAYYLLEAQSEDGVYRAGEAHYTSVIYPAKNLMELLAAMRPLLDEPEIKKSYNEIYHSVQRAMDELVRSKGNISTEGQLTFEDAMISCSALQLFAFALLQDNAKERKKYADAGYAYLEQHDCLEQLVIPDSRMRSATLRFWEAQYDVLITHNMFNSPHGWSSFTTYANYYAYMLSGELKYLQRTFNGLGSAMQVIDFETGKLRWAFITDPYLKVRQVNRNIDGATPLDFPGLHYHADLYPHDELIMGEQYVDMVSDWFFANSTDNDVHEHFKCLEEIALTKAYIAEDADGGLISYNCTASKNGNTINIEPGESMIEKIHFNLAKNYSILVQTGDEAIEKEVEKGLTWVKIK